MAGADEVPTAGDPEGGGQASITFEIVGTVGIAGQNSQVCWDLVYRGIAPPDFAHIHRGAAGVSGSIVVEIPAPNASDARGCRGIQKELADEIVANPSNFYVDVHNARVSVWGDAGSTPRAVAHRR